MNVPISTVLTRAKNPPGNSVHFPCAVSKVIAFRMSVKQDKYPVALGFGDSRHAFSKSANEYGSTEKIVIKLCIAKIRSSA